jgi:ankyrin repeat protein
VFPELSSIGDIPRPLRAGYLSDCISRSERQNRVLAQASRGVCPKFVATGSERLHKLRDEVGRGGIFVKPRQCPLLLNCFIALGNVEAVRYLVLERKLYAHGKDCFGWTSAHVAVQSKHLEIIKLLFDISPDSFEVTDADGMTPLDLAGGYGHVDIVHYLLKLGIKNHNPRIPEWNRLLEEAIQRNDVEFAKDWFTASESNQVWKRPYDILAKSISRGEAFAFISLHLLEHVSSYTSSDKYLDYLEAAVSAKNPSPKVVKQILGLPKTKPKITSKRQKQFKALLQYARKNGLSEIADIIANSDEIRSLSTGLLSRWRSKKVSAGLSTQTWSHEAKQTEDIAGGRLKTPSIPLSHDVEVGGRLNSTSIPSSHDSKVGARLHGSYPISEETIETEDTSQN